MDDSSKYSQKPKLDGNKSEVFRVYYDKNRTTFDEFLITEHLAISRAAEMKWLIFKAFPSKFIEAYMICKN